MTLRTKIFFFGGIILLLIVGLILAVVLRGRAPVNDLVNAPIDEGSLTEDPILPGGGLLVPVVPEKPVTLEEVKEANSQLAFTLVTKNFVERFGSYSLEANFSNFQEVADLITPTVQAWLEKYPADLLQKLPEGFEGVTTRVLSQTTETASDSAVSLLVSTQREERVSGVTRVYYQDMKVNLVLRNGSWLVDGAYWQ